MRVTEQTLLDNGWENTFLYTQYVSYSKSLGNNFDLEVVFFLSDKPRVQLRTHHNRRTLPNVTTLEALAQLEYLLSPYTVMDTAPIDRASRARFAEGGEG